MKLFFFALFFIVTLVECDLPVHCLWRQVQGKWRLGYSEQNLGHSAVDICQNVTHFDKFMNIELKSPNVVVDLDTGMTGTFTLIYDQGFEMTINGLKFFTFFYYTETKDEVISHCGQTFTGTYHDAIPRAKFWGCFQGSKATDKPIHRYPKQWLFDLERENAKNDKYSGKKVLSFRVEAHKEHHREFQKPRTPDIKSLPTTFDWRNVGGVSYVNPVRDQAHCGSCFAFASAGSLSSRVWIQTGLKKKPVFSPQKVLDCSRYAQGCLGGFSYLTGGKYAEDFGMVDESCYPYEQKTDKCRELCTERTYAGYYYYIGGYYGGCTAEGMMKEVYENGPIPVAFEVTADFKKYEGGVWKCNTSSNNEIHPPSPWWIQTNHAVQVVGWGEDKDKTPYWIVKNSWGESWGLNGYFLIRRGQDDCGIESTGFASTPLVF